ncbi:M16 family metallopeptidase [Luteimonas sp. MHLX1A]|uniref:M16 family metallopeptidase n=1 Tax=Alterluteimonas muca TaxID=2878684 RepID=UPI001E617F2E|nr:pitrilysin family protein [Luteimonas sp. MHLX1A]MCD9046388.1 insulinase family protein [Luteimonas sp. MHLX1A]
MAIHNRSARGAILRPLALALGACLFAGMAHAQQPGTAPVAAPPTELPAGLPDYDADRALPELGLIEHRLDNGLTVWVLPRQGGLPKVNYVLAVRGGLASDPKGLPGMSNLLAGLLQEGTATRSSVQIAEELQRLGASMGASASSDGLLVMASGLSSSAQPLADLFADVVRNPAFPANEVQLAKTNALQSLKAMEAQPGYQANRAMGRLLFGDHPYGNTLPTEAGITATDVTGLQAAHTARFRPDQALLVIAGPVDGDQALALARSAFGDWRGEGEGVAAVPAPDYPTQAQFVLIPRAGSVQSAVRIGRPAFDADDDRAIPAALANTILGGGFDSRLMRNLREDKGYTYGAGSSFGLRAQGGAFQAQADVRNEVTGAAIGEFLKEFEAMRTSAVQADELQRAKRYTAGTYLFQNQLQGAVASALASNWVLGRPADYLSSYVDRTSRVTAAQVQAVAREFFDPARQSIVVVGDAGVADQLAPYGDFSAD